MIMNKFHNIQFQGTFRNYQQRVLDHAGGYLKRDGKIHIVAAPGSGKTILGLELIKRLEAPALILSPTVIIRQQWGDRFVERYLPVDESLNDYFSFSLSKPGLITSITYQSLHSAYKQEQLLYDNEDGTTTEENYTNFNLINFIKTSNIRTLCLDEAHHLKNEWQKSLEQFILKIGDDVSLVALTATPPYDAITSEWERYIAVCGDIDEEISVPELVRDGTLCPHQDYIYYSYPNKQESKIIEEFYKKADGLVKDFINSPLAGNIIYSSKILSSNKPGIETILEYDKQYIALLGLAKSRGEYIPKRLVKLLCANKKLPAFDTDAAEVLFRFIIDNPNDIFPMALTDEVRKLLQAHHFIKGNKISLVLNDQIENLYTMSLGKLNSIMSIAQHEYKLMGGNLRMLVLTDNIHKEMLNLVGTDAPLDKMGTVPVFEVIRRGVGNRADIGVVSGSLVLWPSNQLDGLKKLAGDAGISVTSKELPLAPYCEVQISGGNRNKVSLVTEAFSQGLIQILVGTKALLGEGWDSPCINSLIMASFIGSFMLSNQMRGRAIRRDPLVPDKCANIWHLVTLDNIKSNGLYNKLTGQNYKTSPDYIKMARRFACFMAPAYFENVIENGIDRVDISKNNATRPDNNTSLKLSADRIQMSRHWGECFDNIQGLETAIMNKANRNIIPPRVRFISWINACIYLVLSILWQVFADITQAMHINDSSGFYSLLVIVAVTIILLILLGKAVQQLTRVFMPTKTIGLFAYAILDTLKELGHIESTTASINIEEDEDKIHLDIMLCHATEREKHVFSAAISELLSPIENPRYVLTKKTLFWKLSRLQSYACPSVIGSHRNSVEVFRQQLKRRMGKYEMHYTRNEYGRKTLIFCRRYSIMNINNEFSKSMKRLYG